METKEREALLAALLDGRLPDKNGRFGPFGGRYVPETLMPAIERLTHGVEHSRRTMRLVEPVVESVREELCVSQRHRCPE